MQINNVANSQIIEHKQNFKGNSANSSSFSSFPSYQPIPLGASKAYVTPQITQSYKEIETFDVPYIGKGKLYELANGHKVVIIQKNGQTTINTTIKTGEINEQKGLNGISHLLEHLVSDPKNNDTFKQINDLGIYANATTCPFSTSYYMNSPLINSENLETFISLQAQTIKNNKFSFEDIEKEKAIINAEINSEGKNKTSKLLAYQLSTKNLFNSDINNDLSQTNEDNLNNITLKDLNDYYNRFYTPNNMVTTIVGNVNFDTTIKLVNKYFRNEQNIKDNLTKLEPSVPLNSDFIQKPVRKDIRSQDENMTKTLIQLSFVGPKNNNCKDIVLLSAVNKAIQSEIRKNEEDENIYIGENLDFGTSSIIPNPNAPRSIEFLNYLYNDEYTEDRLKNIYSIIFGATQKLVTDEELSKIKTQLKNDFCNRNESSDDLAQNINSNLLDANNIDVMTKTTTLIDSITPQDIQKTAQKYLDLNKASIVIVHPPLKTLPNSAKKTNKISFSGKSNDPLDSLNINEYLLPNNLKVVIDSRPGTTKSTVYFELNSKELLKPKKGVGLFLNSFIENEKEIKKNEQEGIQTNFIKAGSQCLVASACCTPDKTLQTIEYLKNTLLNPNFDQNKFNEQKDLFTNLFDKHSQNIIEREEQEFYRDNPYYETGGNYKNVYLNDLKVLHNEILQNAQGTIIITIPPEALKDFQGKLFQSLSAIPNLKTNDYKAIYDKFQMKPLQSTKIYLNNEDKTDNQVEITQKFKIIESENINDVAGLMVLNQLLNLNAFNNLREDEKIAYNPKSSYTHEELSGKVSEIKLNAEVTIDNAANKNNPIKIINGFRDIINKFVSTPVTQEELDAIKITLKSDILRSLETSYKRNNSIVEGYNSFYGVNYQKSLLVAIDNITPENVQKLAQYYLTQPSHLIISGNKKAIESNNDYLSSLGEVVST